MQSKVQSSWSYLKPSERCFCGMTSLPYEKFSNLWWRLEAGNTLLLRVENELRSRSKKFFLG